MKKQQTLLWMLKKSSAFICLALILLIAGCTTTEKVGGGKGANGYEDLYDSGALPERDERVNPEGADYRTLAAHTIYFGTDSFTIDSSERSKVEKIADWMRSNPEDRIIIAGHCDSRGTTQYNLALGERRALAIREYLIGLGARKKNIFTVSYGEERPAVLSENESAWTKNRRAQAGILK